MENFLQSVLGISVGWNRQRLTFIFLIGFLSFSGIAQDSETDPELSSKELFRFNELFFKAEKEYNLGNLKKAKEMYSDLYEISSDNGTVCYKLAELYTRQGNKEEAIFYGEKAVSLEPKNKWFKIGLAAVYRQFQISDKQVDLFQQLVDLEPKNPDYHFELALAYFNVDESKKAIKQLNTLEELIGINEAVSNEKRRIYIETGDVEGAVAEIQNLIKAYPKELNYYGILANTYLLNGSDDKALNVYMKMLAISPDDPRPHLDLAEYYRRTGQKDKSIIHLKKAIASPKLDIDRKIPTLLSLFSASEKDTALRRAAYKMLDDVIRTNPKDPKAYAIYGDFLSRDGHNEKALNAYKKAVSLENGGKYQIWEQILLIEIQSEMFDSLIVDGPMAVELFPNQPLPYLFSGIAFVVNDDPEEGVYYLEEGSAYVFGNPRLKEQFYTQLADAYHKMEKHSKSDAYFDKALTLNSQNPTVLNNYAYYLSLRGESLDKALEMTKRSNLLSPNNPTFLDTWAWVLFQRKDYAKALEKMEEVIRLTREPNGEILEHYGDILAENDKKLEALEQYQKAKGMGYSSKDLDNKIKALSTP